MYKIAISAVASGRKRSSKRPSVVTKPPLLSAPHASITIPAHALGVMGHVSVHEDHVRAGDHSQPVHVGRSKTHFSRPRENSYNGLAVEALGEGAGKAFTVRTDAADDLTATIKSYSIRVSRVGPLWQ